MSSTNTIEIKSDYPTDTEQFVGNVLSGINPDILDLIYFRLNSPRTWKDPIVLQYQEQNEVIQYTHKQEQLERPDAKFQVEWAKKEETDGESYVSKDPPNQEAINAIAPDRDMLRDIAVILEPWEESYLNTAGIPSPKGSIGVTVLRTEPYARTQLPPEQRQKMYGRFGVVPLNSEGVLFQGRIAEDGQTPFFEYIPRNIATGEKIIKPNTIEKQRKRAEQFLTQPHPRYNTTTPFGVLTGIGEKPKY